MTKDQQAALEHAARDVVDRFIMGTKDSGYTVIEGDDADTLTNMIAQALAAQRVAGLEAASREARRRDRGAHKELYWLAEWLNAQAQEQRP